jgi:hypothetical protein
MSVPCERRQMSQTTIRMISAIPTPVAVIESGARFWRQNPGSARPAACRPSGGSPVQSSSSHVPIATPVPEARAGNSR